jgi:carbonic anhydrase
MEIICLCGHADCGVTAIQSAQQTSDPRTDAPGPTSRL